MHMDSDEIKSFHFFLPSITVIKSVYFSCFLQVYLFVINKEEDFPVCFNELCADGIMTDYPTKLNNYLKNAGHVNEEETLIKKD